jgi:hypothetical protein
MKFHLLHADWRCSLPASFLRELPGASQVQWLFWEGSFAFDERVIHGSDAEAAELRRIVREVRPYPPVLRGAAGTSDRVARLAGRAWRKAQRLLRTADGKDKG